MEFTLKIRLLQEHCTRLSEKHPERGAFLVRKPVIYANEMHLDARLMPAQWSTFAYRLKEQQIDQHDAL